MLLLRTVKNRYTASILRLIDVPCQLIKVLTRTESPPRLKSLPAAEIDILNPLSEKKVGGKKSTPLINPLSHLPRMLG